MIDPIINFVGRLAIRCGMCTLRILAQRVRFADARVEECMHRGHPLEAYRWRLRQRALALRFLEMHAHVEHMLNVYGAPRRGRMKPEATP